MSDTALMNKLRKLFGPKPRELGSQEKLVHPYLDLTNVDYTKDLVKYANELDQEYFKDPICTIVNTRIPHTIDKNTVVQYAASPETLELDTEQSRRIHAENLEWNVRQPPKLADCCVVILARNFATLRLLEEVPCENRTYLLEILPTDIDLEIVIPMMEYEHYWERRYVADFGLVTYPKRDDWNWKSLYLERYLRKVIEAAQPQFGDEYEMDDLLILLAPYIQTLRVTQLQWWIPPTNMDKEDYPEIYPDDHIDFAPILKKCQKIDEMNIIYGMNNVGEDFEWRMFNVAVEDMIKLGKAVLNLKLLRILRLRRSKIEDRHCQALVRGLVDNTTLLELDLSHCRIGDQGALCLAKLIEVHPTLENLILCDNLIKGIGGEGIGFALLQENSCPLKSLDLRLNPLGHQGALGLMRSLVRGTKPEKINFACCEFEDMTSYIFGAMLKVNRTLTWIDVTNNWFGEFGGENLVAGLNTNEVVKWLDVRETYITRDQLYAVRRLIKRNNNEEESEEESEEELLVKDEDDKAEDKKAEDELSDHQND